MICNTLRSARIGDFLCLNVEFLSCAPFQKKRAVSICKCRQLESWKGLISGDNIFSGVVFWKNLIKTNMPSSLGPLKLRPNFHSTVNFISNDVKVDDTGLSSAAHEKPQSENYSSEECESNSANVQYTPDVERKYVHDVYDAIAPHFSSTRFAKWPKVAMFLNSLLPGSVILDAGCGNGKYLGLNPHCFYIGCDISPPLVHICAGRGHEVMVADAVNLPYRSGFGDAAISIAVLHHLSTEIRRRKAIEELVRVVRVGGLILITVWAVEQEDKSVLMKWTPLAHKYEEEWVGPNSPRVRCSPLTNTLGSIPETEESSHYGVDAMRETDTHILGEETKELCKQKSGMDDFVSAEDVPMASRIGSIDFHQEYFVPWHLPYHRAEIGGASSQALEKGLARKDDKKGAVIYNRYYHVFIEGELERLVSGIKNAFIRDKFYDKSNWCIILEKS